MGKLRKTFGIVLNTKSVFFFKFRVWGGGLQASPPPVGARLFTVHIPTNFLFLSSSQNTINLAQNCANVQQWLQVQCKVPVDRITVG